MKYGNLALLLFLECLILCHPQAVAGELQFPQRSPRWSRLVVANGNRIYGIGSDGTPRPISIWSVAENMIILLSAYAKANGPLNEIDPSDATKVAPARPHSTRWHPAKYGVHSKRIRISTPANHVSARLVEQNQSPGPSPGRQGRHFEFR